jgi:molybdenum cofactor synthesis domain-containing protein
MSKHVTAAVLLIGDEILSGRTCDANLQQIARFLAPIGIQVREARIVPDVQDDIVAAVNALRARYTYVFTTGGIGPTHDDITADAIAAAFGVAISENPEAVAILEARYREMDTDFTPARRRMTRIPHGASLIANPVSAAPGFQMENVFTLAGVPAIVRGMLGDVGDRLEGGTVMQAVTVKAKGLREGDVAAGLGDLVAAHPTVSIGSYPWYVSPEDAGVSLVARGTDRAVLASVRDAFADLVCARGCTPEIVEGEG